MTPYELPPYELPGVYAAKFAMKTLVVLVVFLVALSSRAESPWNMVICGRIISSVSSDIVFTINHIGTSELGLCNIIDGHEVKTDIPIQIVDLQKIVVQELGTHEVEPLAVQEAKRMAITGGGEMELTVLLDGRVVLKRARLPLNRLGDGLEKSLVVEVLRVLSKTERTPDGISNIGRVLSLAGLRDPVLVEQGGCRIEIVRLPEGIRFLKENHGLEHCPRATLDISRSVVFGLNESDISAFSDIIRSIEGVRIIATPELADVLERHGFSPRWIERTGHVVNRLSFEPEVYIVEPEKTAPKGS